MSPWAPLRRPVFRSLWIASLASNVGTWVQNVGAAWLMTSLTPDPLQVSLVQAASNLPFFLLALPAGALADVIDRRKLALAALAWLVAASAALAGLFYAGRVGPQALLALTFAIGVGSALLSPAFAAIVPELVPREELEPAVSLNGISTNLARAVGPALGGLIVASAGVGATFALNALSFAGVVAVLARWRRDVPARTLPPERLAGALRAGIRYVRHSTSLRNVLVRAAAFVLPASSVWALLPLYARGELGLGPTGYGGLLACFGVGAVAGGLLLPRARLALGVERLATASTLLFAAAHAFLGATRSPAVACGALFAAGAAWLAMLSLLNTAAQLAIPSWVRARSLASYMIVLFGGLAAGSAIWGAIAGAVGVPRALSVAAAAILAGRLLTWRRPLYDVTEPDLSPGERWPDPAVASPFELERGPALVTVEYSIDPAEARTFAAAMDRLRNIRLRDGAIRWGLWADTAVPGRYLESFVVQSWLEHLRQHERVTAADIEVQKVALAFHRGADPPHVSHFLREEVP